MNYKLRPRFTGVKYKSSFLDLLDRLSNYKVFILGPTPTSSFNVGECFLRNSLSWPLMSLKPKTCDFIVSNTHRARITVLDQISNQFPNVLLIDVTPVICPNDVCAMEPDLALCMYIDHGHLSVAGFRRVIQILADKLPETPK